MSSAYQQRQEWIRFVVAVENAGLKARDCGNGHWRIEGGMNEVNYYPWSPKRTIYVNRTTGNASMPGGTTTMAILAAKDPGVLPMVGKTNAVRRKPTTRYRAYLLRKDNRCHWCKVELEMHTSSIDHLIPLARGGTHDPANLVLSCRPCNAARGHC